MVGTTPKDPCLEWPPPREGRRGGDAPADETTVGSGDEAAPGIGAAAEIGCLCCEESRVAAAVVTMETAAAGVVFHVVGVLLSPESNVASGNEVVVEAAARVTGADGDGLAVNSSASACGKAGWSPQSVDPSTPANGAADEAGGGSGPPPRTVGCWTAAEEATVGPLGQGEGGSSEKDSANPCPA